MCGIAGWIEYEREFLDAKSVMKAMSDSMTKRGPDESGEYSDDYAYLVHRRLSVVDLQNGKQPMTAGNYTIVYNGELYNTQEIKSELIKLGHEFTSHSDTEVLLKAYIEWGECCLDKLNGIFAFAIWNKENKTLFLARDQMGVKPLFYYKTKNGLIFASEIKTLLCHPGIKAVIDKDGLASIMLLGPAKPQGSGVFKGIEEIPQASCIRLSKDNMFIYEYWHLIAKEHTESFEETAVHTRYLITDSIKRQLISDVPLCTFLSGGLDSSIISAVASKNIENLNTYEIDYKFNDINFKASSFQPNADSEYAKLMSEFLESNHHKIEIDTPALTNALYSSTVARSLPGMADVDSSLWLFCKEIKKDFTVALSGECADEIFGGYPWYYNKEILFCDCFPWSNSTDLRAGLLKSGVLSGIDSIEFVYEHYKETVKEADGLDSDSSMSRRMREMFMLNIRWFMQTLLDRKDRMSMDSSLEVRVPFCDRRIAEYAYNIPWEMKSYNGREKGLIRYAFEGILPNEILWRKKSPYPKTHNPNYLMRVKTMLYDIINSPTCRILEFLNKEKLDRLIETNARSFDKPWYGQLMTDAQVFAYLVQLEYWLKEFDVSLEL